MIADLWTDIQRRLDLLDVSLKEVGKRGAEYAQAEADYRAALAKKILELRADGMPVTITPDIARGTKHIASLKLDRDCKEALYKAALESINVYKLQIKVLEAQMDREYRS
jgi:hypothetical protein|nr:MAG TPA: hypothetical protein [Caudoviricetes sp.]